MQIDHLVVCAESLEEGAAFVEAKLGVAMSAGGKHALMGTHNRLLSLGAEAYLEVIAIDPEAGPPGRARWFGLDLRSCAPDQLGGALRRSAGDSGDGARRYG